MYNNVYTAKLKLQNNITLQQLNLPLSEKEQTNNIKNF